MIASVIRRKRRLCVYNFHAQTRCNSHRRTKNEGSLFFDSSVSKFRPSLITDLKLNIAGRDHVLRDYNGG